MPSYGVQDGSWRRAQQHGRFLGNNSAQTLDDLAESMKYAAPVAAEAGESVSSTAQALGVLANMGIKGSMAGTMLRQIMLRLADPKTQKTLASLGITATDTAGNLRPLGDVMNDIGMAITSLPTGRRIALVKEMFDQRAVAGVLKLSNSPEMMDRLAAALDSAGGSARRTAKTMDSGLGGAFRMMMSAAEGVAIAVGDALSGPLSKVSGIIREIAEGLAAWIEKSGRVIVIIGAVIAAVGAVSGALIGLGTAISLAGVALGGFASAISVIGTILGAVVSPVALVTAAVVALGAAILHYTGAGSKAIEWLGSAFSTLPGDIGKLLSEKLDVRGTFNAANLLGLLTANTTEERTAKASEKTAKNTERMLRELEEGGAVFA